MCTCARVCARVCTCACTCVRARVCVYLEGLDGDFDGGDALGSSFLTRRRPVRACVRVWMSACISSCSLLTSFGVLRCLSYTSHSGMSDGNVALSPVRPRKNESSRAARMRATRNGHCSDIRIHRISRIRKSGRGSATPRAMAESGWGPVELFG